MRIAIDMERENFIGALANEDVRECVEFYLEQEFSQTVSLDDFLRLTKINNIIEIMDTTEFDVEESLGKLLDKYNIPYSKFVLIQEDSEIDDRDSIIEAKEIFDNLDIYSEYQGTWV